MISLEDRHIIELKKVANASELIRNLLDEYFSKVANLNQNN